MIRKLEKTDIEQVMQIWLHSNVEAHSFIPEDYWASNYQMVQEQLGQAEVYVSATSKEIQGFVGIVDGYIAGIFVHKTHRSEGIGKQLLDYVKERYDALTLNVYQKNERAVQFYHREGFSVVSEETDEDTGATDFTMSWKKRKTVLFIAMSLDGYIADSNGGIDWLKGQGDDSENVDTYSEFVKEIDTILMGWNTYHQIVTELSPSEWVYEDFTTYVLTHKERPSSEKIRFTNADPVKVLEKMQLEAGKDIWICGGANLVQQLVRENLIDKYYISVIPTLLGTGIRLFENGENEIKLKLLKTQTYNGITELVYERR